MKTNYLFTGALLIDRYDEINLSSIIKLLNIFINITYLNFSIYDIQIDISYKDNKIILPYLTNLILSQSQDLRYFTDLNQLTSLSILKID
jgi:hypothetical protein